MKRVVCIAAFLMCLVSFANAEPNDTKVFENIDGTISALSSVGIGQLTPWKDDQMGGFMSITSYYLFDGTNTIAYYLLGSSRKKMDSISITANINNGKKKTALQYLSTITERSFLAMKIALPKNLLDDIKNGRQTQYSSGGLKIEILMQKSKIETWTVTISQ